MISLRVAAWLPNGYIPNVKNDSRLVRSRNVNLFIGVDELDQIFTVLLKTSMAVGGIIACLLDNLIPGTPEERGIKKWRNLAVGQTAKHVASIHVYDLPFGIANKWKLSKFLPFLPYYNESLTNPENAENGMTNIAADSDVNLETSSGNSQSDHYKNTTML